MNSPTSHRGRFPATLLSISDLFQCQHMKENTENKSTIHVQTIFRAQFHSKNNDLQVYNYKVITYHLLRFLFRHSLSGLITEKEKRYFNTYTYFNKLEKQLLATVIIHKIIEVRVG